MNDHQDPISKMTARAEDAVAGVVGMASAQVAPTSAQTFASSAAISDRYEIAAGELASQRSLDPMLRRMGEVMAEDHRRSLRVLETKTANAGIALEGPPLDARRQGLLDNLQEADSSDFDAVFVSQQTAAHTEALAMHEAYLERGDNEAMRGIASAMIPVLRQHLDMLRDHKGG